MLDMEQTLQERFEKIRREYKKGKRKLEKLQRKSRAKAHVKQKLREQAGLEEDLTHSRHEETADNTAESRNASLEISGLSSVQQNYDRTEKNCNGLDSDWQKTFLENETQEPIPCHEDKTERDKIEEIKDQSGAARVTKAANDIKGRENDSASPILGESHSKTPSQRRLSLSKYKKKHLTNKLMSSPGEKQLDKSSSTILNLLVNQRNNNGDNLLYEKSLHLSSKNYVLKPLNISKTKTAEQTPEVNESDAIIFERHKLSKESYNSKSTNILDGENDRIKYLDSLSNNLSDVLQDSIYDSPLVSDEGNKIKMNKSLPKQKKRSLNGVRRSSPRVLSSVSNEFSKLNGLSNSMPKKRSTSNTQEHIIVSSMFQCLIDDVKRDNKLHDFELTGDYEKYINPIFCPQHIPNSIPSSIEVKEIVSVNRNVINNLSDSKSGLLASQKSGSKSNCVKGSPVNEISAIKVRESGESVCKHVLNDCPNKNLGAAGKISSVEAQQPDSKEVVNSILMESVDNTSSNNESASQNVCRSPPLFESPTNCKNLEDLAITNADSNLVTSGDLNPVTQEAGKEMNTNKSESDICSQESSSGLSKGVFLEQIATSEIPSGEVVLSLAAADNGLTSYPEVYVVCLFTQSLRYYHHQESSWTCMLNYTLEPELQMKKNSGGRIQTFWLDDKLGVVLQQPKTNLTNLHLYLYRNGSLEHSLIDRITGKSVNVKCLSNGAVLASYFITPSSYVTKYTYTHTDNKQNQNPCQTWRSFPLEKVCGQVTCLMLVQNLDSALIGLTSSRKLYVWNHTEGVVLCSIDLVDVCSKDVFCPSVFLEQGYLFLPAFGKKKGQEVGSIIVVNPVLSTSETLIPLQNPGHLWTGCIWATLLDGKLLCARETTGQLCLWDLYNGHLVTSLDVLTNCFTTTQSILTYVCKNVLHVYNLRNIT